MNALVEGRPHVQDKLRSTRRAQYVQHISNHVGDPYVISGILLN